MKRIIALLCCFAACVILISSCGKKPDNSVYVEPKPYLPQGSNGGNDTTNGGNNGGGGSSSGGSITADIAGSHFASSQVSFSSLIANTFTATQTGSSNVLALSIDTIKTGNHKYFSILTSVMYTEGATALHATSVFANNIQNLSPGTINVTSDDGSKISGDFTCTLYDNNNDSIFLTNGTFTNLKYK